MCGSPPEHSQFHLSDHRNVFHFASVHFLQASSWRRMQFQFESTSGFFCASYSLKQHGSVNCVYTQSFVKVSMWSRTESDLFLLQWGPEGHNHSMLTLNPVFGAFQVLKFFQGHFKLWLMGFSKSSQFSVEEHYLEFVSPFLHAGLGDWRSPAHLHV